jgi:ATP-dependent HslUV protease ATP-binding subunit HslU
LQTNKTVENIGARRLHTIIEKVVEEISFEASDRQGEKVEINSEYVKGRVGELLKSADMRKYIL